MNTRISLRHVIVRLVSGPLYQEETELWTRLRIEAEAVRQHYWRMGLELVLDEDAGYAFLRQGESTEEAAESEEAALPRLLRRTPLGFHPTVLMLLLRERLLQHDQSADGENHLYYDAGQLADLLRPYFPLSTDEKKTEQQLSRTLSRLVDLGILRSLANRSETIYRVEPILRTKLPVDEIEAIRERLRKHLGDQDGEGDSTELEADREDDHD